MEEIILEQDFYDDSLNARQTAVKDRERIHHPITLSLFSGAGGLDIGFHRAGFKIIACVEIENVFSQTLQLNVGKYLDVDCHVLNNDVRDLAIEDTITSNIDFIIGGPPCQSFSAIGRRAGGVEGSQNERGGLFEHYCRLVDHYRPKGFLFENVRGILSSNKGEDWKLIVKSFTELGYQLSYRVLDTADYGVPQHRERIIMVGTEIGLPIFNFPRPTHGPDSSSQRNYVSALEAIADLQDPNGQPHKYNGKYGSLLEEVPPGQNYHYFTKEMGYPDPRFAWRSRFSDFLYKADPNKPVRTIVAQLGAYSGPFHWLNRKFTLEEFKRLQTFPDDYKFAGGLIAALRQIGNSVPPLFAEELAKSVLQQIFGLDLGLEFIEIDDKLSYDKRKRVKASLTRRTRKETNTKSASKFQISLFKDPDFVEDEIPSKEVFSSSELYFNYLSLRNRQEVSEPTSIEKGIVYQFHFQREGDRCFIRVSRYKDEFFSNIQLLKYTLQFQYPIGNGINVIECILLSPSEQDIPIAWDAIEDCISHNSKYQTMMDVYGHFTEPHPIFDLNLEILTERDSFLLRFAKKFSHFSMTSRVLDASVLRELYALDEKEQFDLTTVAHALRDLRFDIRVHETNLTIPPGHFRCCYPFTLNINKQVSVTWKSRAGGELMVNSEYTEVLSKAYHEAEVLVNDTDALRLYKSQSALSHKLVVLPDEKESLFQSTVAEGIATLVGNLRQSKYLFSMLITGLVEKLVHPSQDIRYTQTHVYSDGVKGFSNRNTDQYYVTPFLKRHALTSCAASGAESGRNFERPEPHTINYGGKPRGKGSKEAYLGILHAVQIENIDPFPCIVLLMALDLLTKQDVIYDYPEPKGLTIQETIDAVLRHFNEAQGNGRARLPVLAIQAIYQCLVPQISRYKDAVVRNPPNRHTGNDKEGWIGDIQVDRLDGTPFEAVEVKAGRHITSDMVRALPSKFQGYTVDRYYILSTEKEYVLKNEEKQVEEIVRDVRNATGCEVIANGFHRSLWYYLRMLEDIDLFLRYYTEQVQNDIDTKDDHRVLWASILKEISI